MMHMEDADINDPVPDPSADSSKADANEPPSQVGPRKQNKKKQDTARLKSDAFFLLDGWPWC